VYESGNVIEGLSNFRGGASNVYTSTRFGANNLASVEDAKTAYNNVVAEAGANRQVASAAGDFRSIRDSVDLRIIKNLVNRTGTFVNGVGHNGEAGYPEISWPTLAGGQAAADGDNDGMADDWERKFFGNTTRGSASNSSSDLDGDGYTDLEEYLYGSDPTGGGTLPTPQPTSQPTVQPTAQPTAQPTVKPTSQPTVQPTVQPTAQPTVQPTSNPNQETIKFNPKADGTVSQEDPGKVFADANTLVIDDNPGKMAYLKFNVSGVNGRKVTKVILRLFSVAASNKGGQIKAAAAGDWNESNLTWKTRPEASGGTVASVDQVKADNWYEFDVTSLVNGDGTYAFQLSTPSGDNAKYSSKEGGKAPELIVVVSP
jgi:hypothetical protein